ncbi:MAG TPA: DUF4173 domain-containing protein [Longimicrobiales bacterium]|nr:DUF4173 domain-containing protein [Longimicrobiales bacterium]
MDRTEATPPNSAKQSSLPVDASARGAARILLWAAIAAVPLELLLRAVPWGVNLPLAAAIGAGTLLALTGRRDARFTGRAGLAAVLVALAAIVVWRSESMLWLAVVVSMVATIAVMLLPDARWLRHGDLLATTFRAAGGVLQTLAGPLRLLLRDIDWNAERAQGRGSFAHLRGLAWAVPVVLPFLLLFAEADPAFAAITLDLVDLPRLASHVVLWGALAWLTVGGLGAAQLPWPHDLEVRVRMSVREATWVLGTLAVVFDVFVALQVRWFFGGEALVREMTGLTYADYARRGFFELVIVAALLLVVLVLADWLTRDAERAERRNLRLLSSLLLGLLGVVLASALLRMRLYIGEFGLTELRFFTTGFMLWLVLVFGWYALTVLREERERFVGGVYVSGMAAVLTLAALNPIARVAEFNVQRAVETGRYDVDYALSLGRDAVPVLVDAIDVMPPEHRCPLVVGLAKRAEREPLEAGWRSWNWSRDRAHHVLSESVARFEEMCGPIPPGASR